MAGGSPSVCWADFHHVPVLSLNPRRHALVQIQAQGGRSLFVVGISLAVDESVSTELFHSHFIPETSNNMGMKTFPEDCVASELSKHYIFFFFFK